MEAGQLEPHEEITFATEYWDLSCGGRIVQHLRDECYVCWPPVLVAIPTTML